jgi:hypothetical protein
MNDELQLLEEETIGGFRYTNSVTRSVVGTIMYKRLYDGDNGIYWKVESFDEYMGASKFFKSLSAAKYYLAAFATEAWEKEKAEIAAQSKIP